MIGLVLVTHGRLAVEFITAMEHVVGPLFDSRSEFTACPSIVSLGGEARSRCRTIGENPAPRNRCAISAAAATDRWRPPVQPKATVR